MPPKINILIRQDTRFHHRFSLKFGVKEYTDEEYDYYKKQLFRTFGIFVVTTTISIGTSFLLK